MNSSATPAYSPAPRPVTPGRRIPKVHILLFVLTFVTTNTVGSLLHGSTPSDWAAGLPYSVTLLSILLFHEFGHFCFARLHQVRATYPFLIPFPLFPGTFGAVIMMERNSPHRRALFDIGVAGPLAGFLVAVPAVMLGLYLSDVQPLDPRLGGMSLGTSWLFRALTYLVLGVDERDVLINLHPIAVAGWVGLFVTMLNLLPVAQLDGGHISYAVFGRFSRYVSLGTLVFMLVLGLDSVSGDGWPGWLVWGGLVTVIGINHPPTLDQATPLTPRRLLTAGVALLVLIATFVPNPFPETHPLPAFPGERTPVSAPEPERPHGFLIAL